MIIREKMRGVHPRLEYTKEQIAELKEKIAMSAELQAEFEEMKKNGDRMMEEELMVYDPNMNMAAACGQFGNMTGTFTSLYLLGETKYIAKMKEAALNIASYKMWCNRGLLDKRFPWHSELNNTMLLHSMAVVYDTMYDTFTEEERKVLRDAIMEKGIMPLFNDWMNPGTRIHALDSMGHNWWAVCIGNPLLALCAVYDEIPDSIPMLENAVKSLRAFCEYNGESLLAKPANFDENGMFYEGALYFNYGIGEMCHCLHAYKNCFEDDGDSDIPVLKKAPNAFLSLAYPISGSDLKYLFADFGDSNPWIGGHSPMVKCMLIMGLEDENLKRFFNRAYGKPSMWDMLRPDLYECDGKRPTLPKSMVSEDGGICTIRTSDEDDATMLAVRCGHSWNHAHADAGSFLLFHGGDEIFCDSGSCAYGNRNYGNYYTQSKAHSVMLINGEGMPGWNVSRGSRLPGHIEQFTEDGKLCCFIADATGPYSNQCYRNQRTFLRLDDELYVIIDDVTCYNESEYSFLLHYKADMTEDGDTMIFKTERNRAVVKTTVDRGFTRQTEEFDGHKWVSLNVNGKDRRCAMMNAIVLGEEDAEITPIEGMRWYGFEIKFKGNKYRVYYNHEADGQRVHDNSLNMLDSWMTDAYILCDMNDGEKVIMMLGSILRKDGENRFDEWKKQTKIL